MDIVGQYKAKSFFGCLSVRTGLLVIAALQVLTGLTLYFILQYLRPSLHATSWGLFVLFSGSALIGFWGAWRRSQLVEAAYLLTFVVCTAYLCMTALDFSDVVHLLPRAPVGPSEGFFLKMTPRGLNIRDHPNNVAFQSRSASHVSPHAVLIEVLQHVDDGPDSAAQKLYNMLPYMPHNETEGESEEASVEEMPPEVKQLSEEGQAEVVALSKLQKRPVKLFASGLLGMAFLFYLYFLWLIMTFIANKCVSIDVLTGQPEQFEPLVGH